MNEDVVALWIKDCETKFKEHAKSFSQLKNAYEQTKAYQLEQKRKQQAEEDWQFQEAYSHVSR
jgi:hypothetical protein